MDPLYLSFQLFNTGITDSKVWVTERGAHRNRLKLATSCRMGRAKQDRERRLSHLNCCTLPREPFGSVLE